MNKTTVLQIRLTPAQKAEIQRRAKKNGKKVSPFLLDLALQGWMEDVSSEDVPDAEDLRDEVNAIIGKEATGVPTVEEVDRLALQLHNEQDMPMRQALSVALHRLTALEEGL